MVRIILTLFILGFSILQSYGQEAPPRSSFPNIMSSEKTLVGNPVGKVADMAWVEGKWQGEAFGGEIEEIWSAPDGGSMMGMFRLVDDGKVAFYELMIISEVDKTLVLRLKHFNEDLIGWEEKDDSVEFPLVKMTKDKVWFDGYTFERTSDDIMTLWVVIEEDQPEGMKFVYHRAQ